jgi:hypothetical protein
MISCEGVLEIPANGLIREKGGAQIADGFLMRMVV